MPVDPTTPAPAPDTVLAAYLLTLSDPEYVAKGPVQVLRLVRATGAALRSYEHDVARAALENGATLSELGTALGMTKQGAARRYANPPKRGAE